MFRDFTALFRRQTVLVCVSWLAVLAERGDGHSGSHVFECGAGVCVDVLRGMRQGEEAQRELGCCRKPNVRAVPDYKYG